MVSTIKSSLTETQNILDKEEDINPPIPTADESEDRRSHKNIILILISAPLLQQDQKTTIPALSIQKEIDSIVDNLEDIPDPIEIEVIVNIATIETLHKVFTRKIKPLIIHFIGHGMITDDGVNLLLEDRVGIARPIGETELNILLDGRGNAPCQIALLNACHSGGLANVFLKGNVPHVIAINAEDTILDLAARCFAQKFYETLFDGHSILNAFLDGRNAVLLDGKDKLKKLINPKTYKKDLNLQEYFKFNLLPESSNHNELLQLQSEAEGEIKAPILEENTNLNWGEDEENFVGRRIELYQIACNLDEESEYRCVSLHGLGGIGKTALAKAAGRWQHERHRYQDGVWFIELRNTESVAAARVKIIETLRLLNDDAEAATISNSQLTRILKRWKTLLILDDLDHLMAKNYGELVDLLKALLACRKLKLLLTSREDIPSELRYHRQELTETNQTEAIQIFKKYAPKEEEWILGNNNGDSDFEEIIEFLDGYPMAIRLAASYLQEQYCTLSHLKNELWKALEGIETRRKPDRDTSLTITLNLSYHVLPPQAKNIFPLLALFPAGLSEELVNFMIGENSYYALRTLLQYSMAEKPEISSTWRVTLPQPARRYAEEKLMDGITENCYLKALEYFYQFSQNFSQDSTEEEDFQANQQLLKEEKSNIYQVLSWGYESETRKDKVCRSARIRILLSDYWQSIAPGEEEISSLNKAKEAAVRNKDLWAEAEVQKAIADYLLVNQGLDIAKESYIEAIALYESFCEALIEKLEIAKVYRKIAEIWQACRDYPQALSSYAETMQIYLDEGETLEVAHTKIAMGQLQQLRDNLETALENYEEAKQLYLEQNFVKGVNKANALIEAVPKSFKFETVFVNRKGEITDRKTYTNKYFRQRLDNSPLSEQEAKLNNELITLDMVAIPGGTFMMGSPKGEGYDSEKPQHKVNIQPFYISKYPITQGQWKIIAERTDLKVNEDLDPQPSHFQDNPKSFSYSSARGNLDLPAYEDNPTYLDRPVEKINWYQAKEFCARLSKLTGKEYRLPSEAEWEYACRADPPKSPTPLPDGISPNRGDWGTSDSPTFQGGARGGFPFHFGETITSDLANYNGNYTYADEQKGVYRGETTSVGMFPPNAFGLYDLHGNVWEWCEDDWHDNYKDAPNNGTAWLNPKVTTKLLRGGSFGGYPRYCRSASRVSSDARGDIIRIYGFRVVCVLPRTY